MINKENKEIFTILIDTNAIISLSLYYKACELAGLEPNEVNKLEKIKRLLEAKGIKMEWLGFNRESNVIKNGFKTFKYLREKTEQYELGVYFPSIADIEALHLLMERKFDEVLTKKCVPYRLRTKKVFRTIVDFDYNKIFEEWKNFKETLEYQGIWLTLPEDLYMEKGFWKEIFLIFNLLMRYILLGNIDMLIYAISLYLRANEIYTYDTEFRTIVNQIYHPSTQKWKKIAKHLEKDLINHFPSIKEEFDIYKEVKFPKGVNR